MVRALALAAPLFLLTVLAGCMGPTKFVMTLPPTEAPLPELVAVTEPAIYYLFSSLDEKKPIYAIELKKHEKFGFVRTGNRTDAMAKGILIDLPERAEGVTYSWKVAEK